MKKITILDDYQDLVKNLECFRLLEDYDTQILTKKISDSHELVNKLYNSDAIILIRERTMLTHNILSQLPHLKLISQTGKISNHLRLSECTNLNIAVSEGVGSPIAPAELTWALIMNCVRQIPQAIEGMKKGLWQTSFGSTIYGKTVGIWGYGKIGKRVAEYAKAFGAKVLVWGSEESRTAAAHHGFISATSKEHFFSEADIITIHIRLSPTTKGIIKERDLKLMKQYAVFVNTSRAELIEDKALLSSLEQGKPYYAALDVYDIEPIYDSNHPLVSHPRVICTPHIGFVEKNTYELYFRMAFENIINFFNNNPQNIANPEIFLTNQDSMII